MEALGAEAAHLLSRRVCIRGREVQDEVRARAERNWSEQIVRATIPASSLAHVYGECLAQFALRHSWSICRRCCSVTPQPLHARHYGCITEEPITDACEHCCSMYVVPQPAEWPVPLCSLSSRVLGALRVLKLHQGDYLKPHPQGFRRHSRMTLLSWEGASPEARLADLEDAVRRQGSLAFDYLMSRSSTYRGWVLKHREALSSGLGDRYISQWELLSVGIEAAIWPDLFWEDSLLDSRWHGAEQKFASVKQSFVVKLRSPVLDYSLDFPLLQFNYDRAILAKFTGRCAVAQGLSLQWSLADIPETQLYYEELNLALIDMGRTLGGAALLITLAPGAYSVTWPQFVHAMRSEAGVGVLGGNSMEASALLHLLHELVHGYIIGGKNRMRGRTLAPLLHVDSTDNGLDGFACRTEFQDGPRRTGPSGERQVYHGTGLPHVHVVCWHRALHNSNVAQWLSAAVPEREGCWRAAVLRQQQSNVKHSEVVDETEWISKQGEFELRVERNMEAVQLGIRTYSLPLCLAYLCHQDVQCLRRTSKACVYMAKMCSYISKQYGDLDDNWLKHCGSGFHAARVLLNAVKPSEAQMMQFLERGGAYILSHEKKRCLVPHPEEPTLNRDYVHYLQCRERTESMTYLEWMRAFRTDVRPPKLYSKTMKVALAVHYGSKMQDNFFGQWLCANVACRSVQSLLHPDMHKVPSNRKYFCCALRTAPTLWTDPSAVRSWLETEGSYTEVYTRNFLRQVQAWGQQCTYLMTHALPAAIRLEGENGLQPMSLEQQTFHDMILEATNCFDDPDVCCEGFILLGAAGTGKSHVIRWLVTNLLSAEKSVTVCSPTGCLTQAYRESIAEHRSLRIDTVDAIFHLWEPAAQWRLPYMQVCIIDEFLFLSGAKFDAICEQWESAGRSFILVFVGDWQLSPPGGGGSPKMSRHWSKFLSRTLRQQQRSQGVLPNLLLQLRMRYPTRRELETLCGDRVLCEHGLYPAALQEHFGRHPKTVFVAVRRSDVEVLNATLIESLFSMQEYLTTVDCTDGSSVQRRALYRGMRLMITHNVDKSIGAVNGAFVVLRHHVAQQLVVELASGQHVWIHKWSFHLETGLICGHPVQPGYATTLAKMEGRTLESIAIWPIRGCPASGYVAVSRVRTLEDIYWVERPCSNFFEPPRAE